MIRLLLSFFLLLSACTAIVDSAPQDNDAVAVSTPTQPAAEESYLPRIQFWIKVASGWSHVDVVVVSNPQSAARYGVTGLLPTEVQCNELLQARVLATLKGLKAAGTQVEGFRAWCIDMTDGVSPRPSATNQLSINY